MKMESFEVVLIGRFCSSTGSITKNLSYKSLIGGSMNFQSIQPTEKDAEVKRDITYEELEELMANIDSVDCQDLSWGDH